MTFFHQGTFDSFHSEAAVGNFFDARTRGNIYVLDDHVAAGPNFANFDLDEVRIWNVKRTQAEIIAGGSFVRGNDRPASSRALEQCLEVPGRVEKAQRIPA